MCLHPKDVSINIRDDLTVIQLLDKITNIDTIFSSTVIENILYRLPAPALVVRCDRKGKYSIPTSCIQNRAFFATLRMFIKEGEVLLSEVFPRSKFEDLEPYYKRIITDTRIRCVIINPGMNDEEALEVISRLNQVGMR